VLTAYFVVLGTLALTATALPAVEAAVPERLRDRTAFALQDVRVPYLMKVHVVQDLQLHTMHRHCMNCQLSAKDIQLQGWALERFADPESSRRHRLHV
jgi:hypothetical protein